MPTPDHDWGYTGDADTLSNSAGSIAIFPWNPNTKTAEEAKNGRIDAVAWGSVKYVKESSEASVPGSGKSLERKTNATAIDHNYGNAWDSDDNSADFLVQDSPNPQNSGAEAVPPLPELPGIVLLAFGLLMLATYIVLKRRDFEK